MTFRVGMEVVCISKSEGGYGDEDMPVVGSTYTIRHIETDRPAGVYPVGLVLAELRNPPRLYFGYRDKTETSFAAFRFRPAVKRRTDISVFEKMLRQEEHHGLV